MIQYIIILLDDTSTSFCHYEVTKKERRLMPIDFLKAGIRFSMQEDMSLQFVYPDYVLPKNYMDEIGKADHYNIMPLVLTHAVADALVVEDWSTFIGDKPLVTPLIIRTNKDGFFDNYNKLKQLLRHIQRIDIVITDIDKFNKADFDRYEIVLAYLANSIEQIYVEGQSPQLNILTDRMMLKDMNNCGAGDSSITLAPNGKFYICPAFYYEDETDSVGDLETGIDIKNRQLFKLTYAPICRHCDAWQCKRCVWLNRKTTLEVNTPSHEQCVVAHIERNASRMLLQNIRKHGTFLPDFNDIENIDYLDPFEKKEEWK